jgi:hypothetical protein
VEHSKSTYSVVDLVQFFQRLSTTLNPEEVPCESFKQIPTCRIDDSQQLAIQGNILSRLTNEDKDVSVLDVFESDRAGIGVDETDETDADSGESHSLGSRGVLQTLRGHDTLKRGVREGEERVEQEVCCQGALTDGQVGVDDDSVSVDRLL